MKRTIKTILLTGKRGFSRQGVRPTDTKNRLGFTFIEVMVTCGILTFGLVMIYKAFLTSLDHQNHMINRLCALTLIENRIAELQKAYISEGPAVLMKSEKAQSVAINKKIVAFQFSTHLNKLEALPGISQVDLTVAWVEHGHTVSLDRTFFLSRILPKI